MSDHNNSRNGSQNNRADDLSTDNSDYAVALGYDAQKHNAPVVTAKGQGEIAQKIIQLALDNNIEIRQDADLIQILRAVDINEEIPLEAFAAVAEIISYIYQQNGKSL
ncbi:MAG: EscU/YscU/HrcU family type III secretion system export apparatus switch protein [Alphaproteobacteria bacterium]|nr:EscU/YscU/HrcU family type III secretion system export apparatus switch protein [Alphaproteobacteria bacterium]